MPGIYFLSCIKVKKKKTFLVNVIILQSIFLLNKKTITGHVLMFLNVILFIISVKRESIRQCVYDAKEPPYIIVG